MSNMYRRNKGSVSFSRGKPETLGISNDTALLDQLIMSKDGSKTMCKRELRNLQNVMLKTKLANKPMYLKETEPKFNIDQIKDSLYQETDLDKKIYSNNPSKNKELIS